MAGEEGYLLTRTGAEKRTAMLMASEGRASTSNVGPVGSSSRAKCMRAWYVFPTSAVMRASVTCSTTITHNMDAMHSNLTCNLHADQVSRLTPFSKATVSKIFLRDSH